MRVIKDFSKSNSGNQKQEKIASVKEARQRKKNVMFSLICGS